MTAHNLKDLTGQKFGTLTVIERAKNDKYGRSMWLCECDCGGKNVVLGYYLKTGRVQSCGCITNRKINGMTLFRKIKRMTFEEMAEWLTNRDIDTMKQILEKTNITFDEKHITTRFATSLKFENMDYLKQEVQI